jgi:hypothetical protein
MSNMHYCRFQNTYTDLYELYNDFVPSTDEERKFALKLMKLIIMIAAEYSPEDFKE